MQGKRGFTILEVLITVVILSVAILALSSLQTKAVGTNYTSHRMTIATTLAQEKLEELQNLPYTDSQLTDTVSNFTSGNFNWSLAVDHTNIDGLTGVANPIDETGAAVPAGSGSAGYWREWNVADNTPMANMKTVSVRVRWSEKRAKSVTIDTVISDG